jgi:hypothetical protein
VCCSKRNELLLGRAYPAAILRDCERKDELFGALVDDLRIVAERLRIASRS